MAAQGINSIGTSNQVAGIKSPAASVDTKSLTRAELSPADEAVRSGVVVDQGQQAFAESVGAPIQLAGMTPSEFWGLKLGECLSKGISMADCTPWS